MTPYELLLADWSSLDARSRAGSPPSRAQRHAHLRELLGAHLGMPAREVVLEHDPFGRPQLTHESGLHVSTAHDGRLFAVAIGPAPLGIDLERIRPLPDWRALALDHLPTPERAALQGLPESEAPAAFLAAWTRLEACAKLGGRGITSAPAPADLPTPVHVHTERVHRGGRRWYVSVAWGQPTSTRTGDTLSPSCKGA